MTLSEILATFGERPQVEAWAYGTERECPGCADCDNDGPDKTLLSRCHSTGKVREPGLVDRLWERLSQPDGYFAKGSYWSESESMTRDAIFAALRAELGVPE